MPKYKRRVATYTVEPADDYADGVQLVHVHAAGVLDELWHPDDAVKLGLELVEVGRSIGTQRTRGGRA